MKKLILVMISLLSNTSFAFFCPTNFQTINVGDSLEQVIAICGPATSQKVLTMNNQPTDEAWTYYKQLNSFDPSTVPVRIVFKDNQVIHINIDIDNNTANKICQTNAQFMQNSRVADACLANANNMHSVAKTTICGAAISIGDAKQNVLIACGKPVEVKSLQPFNQPTPEARTELDYNSTPRVALIFQNNQLVERDFI